MTVSNTDSSVTYTGNGLTTDFPFTFIIFTDTDVVKVLEIATNLETTIDPADYTITGLDSPSGGTVTYPLVGSPLAATHKITISRVLDIAQTLDLNQQSAYNPAALELQLDRYAYILGQQQEQLSRALIIPAGSSSSDEDILQQVLTAASATAANVSLAAAAQAAAEAAETAAEAAAAAAAASAGTFTAATVAEMFANAEATHYINSVTLGARFKQGTNITAGAAIVMGDGHFFELNTSATAITSFSFTNDHAGRTAIVRFNTVRTLTYNAASLLIPGNASLTTAAGDTALIMSLGGGAFIVLQYTRKDGRTLLSFTSTTPGLVPASGGGTTNFMRADGTWATPVSAGDTQTFTASGTWTKPSMGTVALIRVWAGGGSGGRGTTVGGGAGGGYVSAIMPLAMLGATETVTVGAGGAAKTGSNGSGNAGGNSSFGAWLIANGGPAGGAVGTGGDGTSGSGYTTDTDSGGDGGTASAGPDIAAAGAAASKAGGGGGARSNAAVGAGGVSTYGGSGGAGHATTGIAGTIPAGGGGAAGTTSGAGARGQVEVYVF